MASDKMYQWENEFLSDRWELHCDGELLAIVDLTERGGWNVMRPDGQVIATRDQEQDARDCAMKLLGERGQNA